MYKYTKKGNLKTGTVWKFVPPQAAVDAGVVQRQTFKDGRAARYEIPRLIEKVEALTGEKVNLDINDGVNEQLAGKEQYNIITSAIPTDPTTSNSNASSVSGTGTSGGGY